VAKLLLAKSANLNATAVSLFGGLTPLQVAEKEGNQEIVKLLGQAIDCQWNDWSNWSSCQGSCGENRGTKTRTRGVKIQAAHGGQPCAGGDQETKECTRALCPTTTTTPKTTTAKDCIHHWDCGTTQACNQRKCMDLCFSDDCNKAVNNAKDRRDWTPLHQAAEENNVAVAKALLANSADLDSTDKWGATALHRAALWSSVDVAKLLLANSAHVDSADNDGATALHWAAWNNRVEVAKLLLAKSANVNATPVSGSWKGLTPLQIAERRGNQEMVELLRNA